jgi:hypothetical protein
VGLRRQGEAVPAIEKACGQIAEFAQLQGARRIAAFERLRESIAERHGDELGAVP